MQNFSRERRKIRENLHWFPPRERMEHEFLPLLSQECTKIRIARGALAINLSRSLCLWDSHQRQFLSLLLLLFPSWILWCPERVICDAFATGNKHNLIWFIIFVQKNGLLFLCRCGFFIFYFFLIRQFLILWALKLKLVVTF